MSACPHPEEVLTLFAAEALEPPDEARVRAHLEGCATCRHEVDAQRQVLGLAALPPLSPREQAVLQALPRTTVGAWRRDQVRRASRLRTTGGLLAVAAALLLLLGPVLQRVPVPRPGPSPSTALAPAPADDETSFLEAWALADPLTAALDESDTLIPEDGADDWDVEPEEFLLPPTFGDAP